MSEQIDEAREDVVFGMLVGAWSMMVDDLSGKGAAVSDEGLKLLQEFVEMGATEDKYDFPYCRYCGRNLGDHREPCLWSRARAYLRDQGVEMKDSE